MKKVSVRYALFAVFVLVTVAGPGVPVRAVRTPRGVGCGGGARVAPKVPVGGARVVRKLPTGPRVVPKPATAPKVAPKAIAAAPHDPHAPLPARLGGQRDVLRAHAATRDWARLSLAAGVPPGELPAVVGRQLEGLQVGANGLKALGRLRGLVHGPWPPSVSAEEVAAGAGAFAETAPPPEAALMRRYLALRAEMEGRPDVARRLLRPGEVLEARSVLRDLKVLKEISATPPPTSPLGDVPLPEPEPLGLKAPVREALDKDLPGLVGDLPEAELPARRGALRAIEASADTHWQHITLHLHNLRSTASASEPDDREGEVERRLGRPLTPAERLLARRLLRTRRPAEVAAALRPVVRK